MVSQCILRWSTQSGQNFVWFLVDEAQTGLDVLHALRRYELSLPASAPEVLALIEDFDHSLKEERDPWKKIQTANNLQFVKFLLRTLTPDYDYADFHSPTARYLKGITSLCVVKRFIDLSEARLQVFLNATESFNPVREIDFQADPVDQRAFESVFDRVLEEPVDWPRIQDTVRLLYARMPDLQEAREFAQELLRSPVPVGPRWSNSVPVIADDVRPNGVVRLNYLIVETDLPSPGWTDLSGGHPLPILLAGLKGVVLRPVDTAWFGSPEQIDALFDQVEADGGSFISMDDVWMPQSLFQREVLPGNVFRVTPDIFREVSAFREGAPMDWVSFAARLRDLRGGPEHSEVESFAFQVWSNEQILRARNSRKHRAPQSPEEGHER